MKIIATYNLKGGVGKTAAAVNLAWLAAASGLRTLLWDLDAQGAASFYLRVKPRLSGGAAELLAKRRNLARAIRATDFDRLELVPSDFSYRNLDLELNDFKKSTLRLGKLVAEVADDYDLVFLDCAPSMSVVSENVFNMADVLLVPLIPTHLSLRAFDQLARFRQAHADAGALLLPFFSMVDRRKRLHRDLIVAFAREHPEVLRSFVPYASAVEQMGEHRAPVNVFADSSSGGRAFRALWQALAERLDIPLAPAS
jgi:chromosome partitioning protein